MKYEVWQVPVEGTWLIEEKKLATFLLRRTAEEYLHFEWIDDPVPDKADYYRLEIRETTD